MALCDDRMELLVQWHDDLNFERCGSASLERIHSAMMLGDDATLFEFTVALPTTRRLVALFESRFAAGEMVRMKFCERYSNGIGRGDRIEGEMRILNLTVEKPFISVGNVDEMAVYDVTMRLSHIGPKAEDPVPKRRPDPVECHLMQLVSVAQGDLAHARQVLKEYRNPSGGKMTRDKFDRIRRREALDRMLDEGRKATEIAEELGLSVERVRKLKRRREIKSS